MKRSEMVTYLYKLLNTYEDCKIDETVADDVLEGIENMGMLPPDSYYDEDQGIVPFWELEDHEVEAIEKERREFFENLPRNLPTYKINSYTGKKYQGVRHKYAEAWNEGLTLQEIADKFNVTPYRVESFLRIVERQTKED